MRAQTTKNNVLEDFGISLPSMFSRILSLGNSFRISIVLAFAFLSSLSGFAVDYSMNNSINTIDCTVANNFFDAGGAGGNYANSESFEMIFAPSAAGHYISLDFSSFDVELNADFLSIYDGPSSSFPLIGTFTGSSTPDLIVATGSTGSLTVTFSSDNANNASGWEAIVNQTLEIPFISCPADESYTCPITLADYTGLVTLTNGNSCLSESNLVYSQCPAPGTTIDSDTQVVINVSDAAGNNSSCSFEITINDSIEPVISCIGDQSMTLDGNCEYTVPDYISLMTVSDNCTASPTVYQYPAAGTVLTTDATVNIYAVDDSNNMSSCSFQMTTTGGSCTPTGGCSTLIGDYSASASITDSMDPSPTVLQIPPAGTIVYAETEIILIATDNANNSSQCSFIGFVNDNIDPIIACPSDQNVAFDAACEFILLDYSSMVTASDNCDGNLTITQSPVIGSSITGATTITMTATDDAGNSASCTFDIIPSDDVDPVITVCPSDVVEQVNANCEFALSDYTSLATATDNCDTDVSFTQSPIAGTVISGNATVQTVTITATDDNGNFTTCSFDVTLEDSINPTITCPADVAQGVDLGVCEAAVTILAPATADNCGVVSVINDYNNTSDASDIYAVGTTTVVWTVTDINGNTATCTQTVVISDDEDPSITCPVDVNQTADLGVCEAAVTIAIPATADNCGVASVTNDYNNTSDASDIYAVGTTTVVWTVTDIYGNTSTCTQTIIITDDENPTITCPADVAQTADLGVCEANVTIPAPATADNCTVASAINDYNNTSNASDIYPVGTTTVVWTVTDAAGNTATCSMDIVITDNENPTITCPSDVNQTADAGLCEAAVTIAAAATNDNCGVASVTNDYNNTSDASDIYPVGTTTVVWTVTDIYGNINTCTQTVTITDDEDPSIACPGDQDVSADMNCEFTMADYTAMAVTADNCTALPTVTQSPLAGTVVAGTTVVTLTSTDDAGNSNSCSFTVIVTDTTDPVITVCPSNVTEQVNANCEFALSDYTSLATATDNCDTDVSFTQSPLAGTIISGNATVQTVTITATDDNGNFTTCSFDVTLEDSINPTITCPADVAQGVDLGVCEAAVTIPVPVAADNCGVVSVINDYNNTSDASDIYAVGTTTVVWTVTDINGNTATCTQTVVISDDEDPSITCPADVNQTADLGVCEAAVTIPAAVTADNCGVASVTNDYNNTSDASDIYAVGTTTVVWTVTDIYGNTSTCTQTIIITDDEDPTITCPADVAQTADLGVCEANVTIPAPATADNCTVASAINDYNNTSNASDIYPVGTTTVVWTVTDAAGNTATCSMDIVITDNENPTITCPADITQGVDAGTCVATVTTGLGSIAPTTGDNCGVANVVNDYNGTDSMADVYPVGITTVVWTVTDIYGNVSTCSMTVTILDDEDPTIACPGDQNVSADANCEFTMADYTGLAVVTDNCTALPIVTQSPVVGTIVSGTATVTLTVTDDAGNTSSCTFDVIVDDTTDPIITVCPSDVTEQVDANCEFALSDYTTLATATDNCDTDVSFTQSPIAGTIISGNATIQTITITATDDSGNITTCSFDVTLEDTIAPTIDCPDDIVQTADAGLCEAMVTIPIPVVDDNCGIMEVVNDYNNTNDASDVYPVGTTTVEWRITDTSGNTAICLMDITITDNENPTITCPADLTQTADADVCEALVAIPVPATADNCGVDTVVNDYNGTTDASDVYPVGTTTILWTVTDIHGNVSTCSMTVTVTDNEDPTITCPADLTQTADADVCEALVAIPVPATADNCDVDTVVNDYNGTTDASDVYPVGTTTILWTVTDIHGNVSTCSMTVTVTDNENPTITCPADLTQTADADVCEALVAIPVPATADNCDVDTVVNDYNGSTDASDVYPVGTTTILWTVTDIHGNVSTCSMTVTVTDDEDPTIMCPADISQPVDMGVCEAAVIIITPTTADNCGVDTVINDFNGTADASDVYPIGTTIVVWTVTDIHGNSTTCSMTISITDDELPTITCPADINQTADTGVCEAIVSIAAPIAADNCGIASVLNDYNGGADASDVYPVGTTIIVWTVIDLAGNSETCSMTVTITDNENPTITCPADLTQTADAGVCEALVAIPVPATADNCGVDTVVNDYNGTTDASDVYPVGTTTILWTVTDIHGNVSTCSMTVTVTDDEAPVLDCVNGVSQIADAGVCEASVVIPVPGTADNCGVATLMNDYNGSADASDIYPVGLTTITWTLTDIHGNVSTCSMTVTVDDTEAPVITCPADITQTADAGVCETAVIVDTMIASDNCAIDTIVNDYNGTDDASDVYPVGTTTVVWTVTDIHGNVSTCSIIVTVTDDEAPVITCPADMTQTADAGVCEAAVSIPLMTNSDNCAIDAIINDYNNSSNASDVYPVGTTTVVWMVTDIHGNVSTCSMTVTVTDDEAPVITCPTDITQTADAGVCEAAITVDAMIASDNCAIDTIVNDYNGTDDASDVYPVGATTVVWTVTDIHGNVSTCSMIVTITDDEVPVITCPVDITQTADAGVCEAAVIIDSMIASDNCAIDTIVNDYNGTDDASDVYPVGTTTVVWTVTDIHGNVSTCSISVTVTDDEMPVITCPADIAQTADAGVCEAAVTIEAIIATDNCTIDTIVNDYNGSDDASDVYPVGTTTVVWTVTDIHGNVSTCSMIVLVTDDEAPVITCPADITQTADAGVCEAMVTVPAITNNDNCATDTIVNDYNGSDDASDVYPVGTTTVVWTVTDIHGNVSTCSMTVTVTDDEIPVITCPTDNTQTADAGVCEATVSVDAMIATDNCDIATIVNDYNGTDNASDVYPVGTTTVVWTVTDIHGNVSICSTEIIVTDDEAPVFECPENIEQTADTGVCEAAVTVITPIASDNCVVETIVNDYNGTSDASDVYTVGTTTVTWTVTDIHGNTTDCTMEIIVTDDEEPLITCPENFTQTNDAGVCGALVNYELPIVSDNCAVDSLNMIQGLPSGDLFPIGETELEFEVIDIHGNSTSCEFTITVTDDEAPVIVTCTEDIAQSNDEGICGAIVEYAEPIVSDNCMVEGIEMVDGIESGEEFPLGTTTVTWMITDESGNTTFCSFDVTITDDQAPVVTCPEDIIVGNDEGICGAFVEYDEPVFFDNCGGEVTYEMTTGIDSGELFPVGTTTITFVMTDEDGNQTECSFNVIVEDTEAPVIECPEDIVQVEPIVEYDTPFYSDNCEAELVLITGLESGEVFPHGYTTVTYVAIDLAGNTDTCYFEVLVNTPPTGVDDVTEYLEEDEVIDVDVLDNDFDIDGDDIHISDAWVSNGQIEFTDSTLTYIAPEDYWCGDDTITYIVCDTFNACDTAIVIVEVECYIDLLIPEGFSPNGDGVNDTFIILGLEDYPDNNLTVYNRWGHKIFEEFNYQNGWDGRSQDKLKIGSGILPKGTYFYLLETGDPTVTPIKGFVYLNY